LRGKLNTYGTGGIEKGVVKKGGKENAKKKTPKRTNREEKLKKPAGR